MNEQPRHPGNSPASRDIASLVHPYTNLKQHQTDGPLIIERGRGIYVYDDSGKEYIEGMAGLWCTALGFGDERLVAAGHKALSTLPFYHQFTHKSHMPGIELAEKLLSIAPVPMSKVFFANSGSEANDTAIKLAWYYHNAIGKPEKKKIISRVRGYHGVTVASASLTGLVPNHKDFDLPIAGILHTDCPHWFWNAEAGESEEDFATRCADSLEKLILDEGPETIAAFFAEPIMGAGGVVVPPATYFEKIQAVLKKYEVLFIVDEVICGFGRTGNMWGTQTFELEPDMISMAKALSSAYLPISALMVSDKVWEAMVDASNRIGVFGHGYTYSGHPVAAAVALEAQKVYEEIDLVSMVRRVMGRFQDGLHSLLENEIVGEVRGTGMIAGVELVADRDGRKPFATPGKVGKYCLARAQEHGLIVRNIMDTMAVCPPLIISEPEIDSLVERLGLAIKETADWVTREKVE